MKVRKQREQYCTFGTYIDTDGIVVMIIANVPVFSTFTFYFLSATLTYCCSLSLSLVLLLTPSSFISCPVKANWVTTGKWVTTLQKSDPPLTVTHTHTDTHASAPCSVGSVGTQALLEITNPSGVWWHRVGSVKRACVFVGHTKNYVGEPIFCVNKWPLISPFNESPLWLRTPLGQTYWVLFCSLFNTNK